MTREYNSQVLNLLKEFIYLAVILLIVLFVGGYILLISLPKGGFSLYIFVGSYIAVMVSPFLFEKRIKELFTRRAYLKFDNQTFSITISHLKKDIVCHEFIFNWDDIKSYKVTFTYTDKLTYLVIYLKNGTSKSFGFKDNKTSLDEALKDESIFKIFLSYIKQYNLSNEHDNKIVPSRGFLNTKLGVFCLVLVIVLLVVATILHIVKGFGSNPFPFIVGVFATISMIVQRKTQKNLFDELNKLG